MSAYVHVQKGKDGKPLKAWRYRKVVKLPNGTKVRISGTPPIDTKRGAEDAERAHVERVLEEATIAKYAPESLVLKPSSPTLTEWFRGASTGEEEFTGRFWTEHAIGEQENRAGTLVEKRKVFVQHIEPALGSMRLDEIDKGTINQFRAELAAKVGRRGKVLSAKTRANVLGVLGTALRYAESVDEIEQAPAFKVKKVEPPEIEPWTFEEYGRLLGAARVIGEPWDTAVLIAGDAGLRHGEIVALEWADLDLVGNAITVRRQERQGVIGPPKGGKARTVLMTPRLAEHLRGVPRIRVGRVVAIAGEGVTEGEAKHALQRICRVAGLPERLWHRLRHTFATHAALLGVNPNSLQDWLGHATLNMTMRYTTWARGHAWPIPDDVLMGAGNLLQPDRRVIAQLGSRAMVAPAEGHWLSRANKRAASATSSKPRLILVGAAGIELVDDGVKTGS